MYTIVNDDEILVGSIVAERYHVRDVLGQGSTGTVFGIEHLSFGREAAMKVLRPRFTSLENVRHVFQGETRAALGITHPSLCEVFDLGTLPDGAPFYVMERLEGETLATRLGRERFSAAAAVDVTMQLLAAMDAVHERQVLLRDLRPQNVFLAHRRGCRPVVKLLDLGLARLMPLERVESEWDALRAVTSAPSITGLLSIPYYLSPERARGDHGLEPSSDVFVAAIMLYETLAGVKPFVARTWSQLVQQITAARPTPLRVHRPDLPDELDALVARALSPNARDRPSTARELQDELRAVFEGARRASGPMRAAEQRLDGSPPSSHERADERYADEMQDQTRTDRRHIDVTLAARLAAVDEASADHPVRTLRPAPMEIEIDVVLEGEESSDLPAATARGSDLEKTLDGSSWRAAAPDTDHEADVLEEEETATLQLNPEIRARIEQLTKRAAPAAAPSRPPPTHPIRPPRQR